MTESADNPLAQTDPLIELARKALREAGEHAARTRPVTTLQDALDIGYARAVCLVEELERRGHLDPLRRWLRL